MKVLNIKNLEKFFEIVNECKGTVELVSPYGDVINLKSNLSKYFSLATLLSNNEIVEKLELNVYNQDDAKKFIKFMEENK